MFHGLRRRHRPDDRVPRPGGVDGQIVEYGYRDLTGEPHPPIVPYLWGQGFPTVFTDVPMINGGKWPAIFLPYQGYVLPVGVRAFDHIWPIVLGSAGTFEKQLVGSGAAPQPAGQATAHLQQALGGARSQLPPAPLSVWAGSFARS